MLAATAAVTTRASAARRSVVAGALVVRCKSAAAAPAADNVKNFKIYRWDPNEKVKQYQPLHLYEVMRLTCSLDYA